MAVDEQAAASDASKDRQSYTYNDIISSYAAVDGHCLCCYLLLWSCVLAFPYLHLVLLVLQYYSTDNETYILEKRN